MIGWLRFALRWVLRGVVVISVLATLALGAVGLLASLSAKIAGMVVSAMETTTGYTVARRDRIDTARTVNWKGKTVPAHQAVSEASGGVRRRLVASGKRRLGTAAAEALPFVGVGVIVAATAYELQQACELSKELRELERAFNPAEAAEDGEICGFTPPSRQELWTQVTSSPAAAWAQARGAYATLPPLALSERYGAGLAYMTAFYENWFGVDGVETPEAAAP